MNEVLKGLPVLALLAAAIATSGCATSLPPPQPPPALALRDAKGETIVVVKVKSPWYATRGIITGKFRDAVPEYQAAKGLLRKQFSFSENGEYGGVYLWRERARADAWFGPEWHARVRKQRGVDGDVRFIDVTRALDGAITPLVFEGPMVVAITSGTLERYVGASGLRAAYEGGGVVVSTWEDRERAQAGLGRADSIEWFDTPVGLVNASPSRSLP